MSGSIKVTREHLERLAMIYVRQSSLAQVRDNTESTARQYGMAGEAERLGWDASKVMFIDADLGLSGRGATGRPGFKELVSRVCLGEVGAIFGLEVSRLGRSSADLQRLIEFCSLTQTLIVDADGIYDLQNFNDRLLLGLKATMSEAELHLLAGRLQESKRAAAQRGDLRFPLPVGYVYDEDGRTVLDPNVEIGSAVADVFSAFEAAGSAYGVVGSFVGRSFPRRAYGGAWAGEIRWGHLTHGRVLCILSNPAYAGVYVFGRYRSQRWVDPEGTIRTRTVERPRAEWPVIIHHHHPAYLSWESFLANEKRLAANHTRGGACPPREGTALLQGIAACGSCGRTMTVFYQQGRASYDCSHARADHSQTPGCRSVSAEVVDAAVATRLLAMVCPEEIGLTLAAADEVAGRRARRSRALEFRLERARFEATRAERAFHHCEPEDRLVARSLERRWEEKLRTLAEAEAALAAAQTEVVPLPARTELQALVADLPRLWASPTTTHKDRKRILRTLVADVTLISTPAPGDTVRVGIHWRSGATEELVVSRPAPVYLTRRTPAAAVDLVRRLFDRSEEELVAALAAAGLLTGLGRPFDVAAVRWVRYAHHIPAPPSPPLLAAGEMTVAGVATEMGISRNAVYYWIQQGLLDARRSPGGRLCVPFPPEVREACRQRVVNSVHTEPPIQMHAVGGVV